MNTGLFMRIERLCKKRGITVTELERELGFGGSLIKQKWRQGVSPSVDRIIKVATYFDVSVDYLLGQTDIESSASELLGDEDIISFQRARQKMTPQDKDRMMNMLRVGFDYAFSEEKGSD